MIRGVKVISFCKSLLKIVGVGIVVILSSAKVWAAGFISHRAVYDIKLHSSTPTTDVQTVSGQTHILFQDVCDGWAITEDYAISFGLGEDVSASFISHYETWESKDGSSFSFSVLENSNIDDEQVYEGFANLSDGYAEAFYSSGSGQAIELPADTVFPVQHMQRLVKKAQDGVALYQSNIFLGGDSQQALYLVNAVLGKEKTTPAPPELGNIGQASYWPITLAYFKTDAPTAAPEYEIEVKLQANGVIRSYLADYGNFVVQAKLSSGESLETPTC